jgi:signal peptidase I
MALLKAHLFVARVVGSSMSPALHEGDQVLAITRWPARWLRRGQIVLISPAQAVGPSKHYLAPHVPTHMYIKRIRAIAGDIIQTSLEEVDEVLRPEVAAEHDSQGYRTWHIPPRTVFVQGDYVPGGYDSLLWGPLPNSSIFGLVVLKLPRTTSESG